MKILILAVLILCCLGENPFYQLTNEYPGDLRHTSMFDKKSNNQIENFFTLFEKP